MKKYNHTKIENKWTKFWQSSGIYKVETDKKKSKFYILDMFPYPSGAGLHVGHPLGYVASDIFARYKVKKGFNVLHPMGFDSFGLPAEQYAIQTGAHPAITTKVNISKYKAQLNKLGLNYDWDREICTSDPKYYKWTQWIFLKFFDSWYDNANQKAYPIENLIQIFEKEGNKSVKASTNQKSDTFSNIEWNNYSKDEKYKILLKYRLAYLSDITVNWCPELKTVLANEEVKNGISERGGYPVIKKKMKQWCLRITAYADRLLNDLALLQWSDSIKETQKNWIGRSEGLEFQLSIKNTDLKLDIYTTRPDTIYGTTFVCIAPEHSFLKQVSLDNEVQNFINLAINKSELDRNKESKATEGIYTGYDAIHPLTGDILPIWISEYVLIGYGTGAVISVPAHDDRDYSFAVQYKLPILNVIENANIDNEAYTEKKGKLINSNFLNGLEIKQAIAKAIEEFENRKIGKKKVNYRLRDAIFSRQRYWGEPFPIYYKNGLPYALKEEELPLRLPEIENYTPTQEGKPPLANALNWQTHEGYPLELNTMPSWAGSSWYFLRYMDNRNDKELASNEKIEYWNEVDLYMGGSEHATGHLLYARFWTKFLHDLGYLEIIEPFKKLINQGMIQGISKFVYRVQGENTFVSYNLRDQYKTNKLHVNVNFVKNNTLDIEKFKSWRPEYREAKFILEDGKYICDSLIEKMSKSKHNTVNPDDIVEKYGADTLRLYSMFLGPLEHSKPWNIDNIEGVYRFLIKLWRLILDENGNLRVIEIESDEESNISINKLLKKVEEDIEKFSFNTCISSFMICLNELSSQNCVSKVIIEKFLICLSPFAPFISEELWHQLGHKSSIYLEKYPMIDHSYLKLSKIEYPIAINGKVKFKEIYDVDYSEKQVKEAILKNPKFKKYIIGKEIKKIIFIKNRMVNIVI